MVRAFASITVLLGVAGCHELFGLDEVILPVDAPNACVTLAPGGDFDNDGMLNGNDACPTVSNQDPHDEDADGTPDVCDECPHFVEAGDDIDCDGIGAACDPDDTVPHKMTFYGFGGPAGITIHHGFTISGDALRATMPASLTYASAAATAGVSSAGMYEAQCTVAGLDPSVYQFIGIGVIDEGSTDARARLLMDSGEPKLEIFQDVTLAQEPLTGITPSVSVRMRFTIGAATLTGELSGGVTARREAPLSEPLVEPVYFGVRVWRDPDTPTLDIVCSYMLRVATID